MGFRNIWVFDSNNERTQYLCKTYKLHAGTFEQCAAADVVIVGIPPGKKFELLYSLIAPGKTIICEKPFVHHAGEAQQLINKATLAGCTLLVAHIRRLFGGIQLARQHLMNKNYGTLLKAEIFEGNRFSYKTQSNYISTNPFGGVLLDTGSHALDAFLFVSNMTSVNEFQLRIMQSDHDKNEPSHEVKYRFKLNDTEVFIHLSRYDALSNKMNLYFEKAVIEVPLLLKPSIRVTPVLGQRQVLTSGKCLNYMSEAFRLQLYYMLFKKDKQLFDARSFLNLSGILQQLYNA